jgi:hypothetical protein
LKTARLNVNQTRLATATTTSLSPAEVKTATAKTLKSGVGGGVKTASKPDCKCRPEEFTCSSSSLSTGSSAASNNSRRKGQLSFTVKVVVLLNFH